MPLRLLRVRSWAATACCMIRSVCIVFTPRPYLLLSFSFKSGMLESLAAGVVSYFDFHSEQHETLLDANSNTCIDFLLLFRLQWPPQSRSHHSLSLESSSSLSKPHFLPPLITANSSIYLLIPSHSAFPVLTKYLICAVSLTFLFLANSAFACETGSFRDSLSGMV